MIKKLVLVAISAGLLCGCADFNKHDAYGNQVQPYAAVFLFDPVNIIHSVDVYPWCIRNKGILTRDDMACVWKDNATRSHPCEQVVNPKLSGLQLDADTRFMNSVCNGWHPGEFH